MILREYKVISNFPRREVTGKLQKNSGATEIQ